MLLERISLSAANYWIQLFIPVFVINMDLCKQASELAHNVIFKTILVAVIIISTIAIFLEIWIMVKTTNRILVHQNTRILIIMHQFWLIVHCITRIFAHTYVLVAHWKTYVDQCGYMMFPWECFMMQIPIILTAFLNATSIPSIVIERAIATYFSSRYEKFGKSIAVILIITQTVIAIGSLLYIFINLNLVDSEKITYCAAANYKDGSKVAVIFGIYAAILTRVQQTPTYALTLPFAIFWTEKYVKRRTQENRQKAMKLTGTETANYYFTIFEAPAGKNA
uniref:G-protein coupled receptors family 1 profile domain-containing protein n=1 Tax=Onchocerca volvulus TaxID=6282 RepID=A0A8R1XPW8_ONCVO